MILGRILSGAQEGADLAGLVAAKEYGIETGGWMPKSFKTEGGSKPEYAELYNIRETDNQDYSERTEKNIQDSDGTIVFALKKNSPGTRLTVKKCLENLKPVFVVEILNPDGFWVINQRHDTRYAAHWIKENNIKTLNVAGNRESVAPGIYRWTKKYLIELFKQCDISQK